MGVPPKRRLASRRPDTKAPCTVAYIVSPISTSNDPDHPKSQTCLLTKFGFRDKPSSPCSTGPMQACGHPRISTKSLWIHTSDGWQTSTSSPDNQSWVRVCGRGGYLRSRSLETILSNSLQTCPCWLSLRATRVYSLWELILKMYAETLFGKDHHIWGQTLRKFFENRLWTPSLTTPFDKYLCDLPLIILFENSLWQSSWESNFRQTGVNFLRVPFTESFRELPLVLHVETENPITSIFKIYVKYPLRA